MAERRMFSKTIIDSDAFLEMPLSSQALYFHLSMRADDDGFINNPKKIQRTIGSSDDDLKLLIAKRFIIPFESGIVVIKHWKLHNYIQKDRYKPTIFINEKTLIREQDNGVYTDCIQSVSSLDTDCIHDVYNTKECEETASIGESNPLYTDCIQNVSSLDTQVRLELGKDRLGKSESEDDLAPSSDINICGKYDNVFLSQQEIEKLYAEITPEETVIYYIDRLSEYMASSGRKYGGHYATIMSWYRQDLHKVKVKELLECGERSDNQLLDKIIDNG